MKNTFGNAVSLTLYGESHGGSIGAVLDGLAPGLAVDEAYIRRRLTLRRPAGQIATARAEQDNFVLESGVFEGKTTGSPLCIRIPNEDARSGDYAPMKSVARPGHADYTAFCKYRGFQDYRGGGHFSGRVTAALVAAGAILQQALARKGVEIGTHIAEIAGIRDDDFTDLKRDVAALQEKPFAVLNDKTGEAMQAAILAAKSDGDSVGGILESAVIGLPAGVGEPWFDTLEGCLAHALFSIPAVKGVEFGAGFAISRMRGSEANDAFYMRDGKVQTRTNRNGGVNGGISNGAPLTVRLAVKPTPTIGKEQQTVDFEAGEDRTLAARGRHDPCIVHRARVVADSVIALVLADLLAQKYGTDWLAL